MNKKTFTISLFDGAFQAFSLILLSEFVISVFIKNPNFFIHLIVSIIFAISSSTIFWVCVSKAHPTKMWFFILNSILGFLLSAILLIICKITFHFSFFPIRETNGADGIIVLFVSVVFFLFSVIFRYISYIFYIKKNKQ